MSRSLNPRVVGVIVACLVSAFLVSSAQRAEAQQCTAAPSAPLNWWPADGDANDIVGGNNGTLQTGATFAVGEVGQAFLLDGDSAYIKLSPIQFSSSPATAWSIDGWVLLDTLAGCNNGDRIVIDVAGSDRDGLLVSVDCSNGQLYVLWGAGTDVVGKAYDPNPLPLGQWVHFAATHDGTTGRLYNNGLLVAATATQSNVATPVSIQGAWSSLGAMRGGVNGQRFWQGMLDEIDVWDRTLAASEVQAIFNAGSAGKCRVLPAIAQIKNLITSTLMTNLSGSIQNQLDPKLNAAIATLDAAHKNAVATAANQLQAFVNAVDGDFFSGKLTCSQETSLVAAAQAIAASLAQSPLRSSVSCP